ncbi:MAG TPA: hypothetical protein VHM69_03550 [Rubrobacter sp.]|nr:hypothetical protein [Rubrobacter sp.]
MPGNRSRRYDLLCIREDMGVPPDTHGGIFMSQGPVLLLGTHQIVASGMRGIAAFVACERLWVVSFLGKATILT